MLKFPLNGTPCMSTNVYEVSNLHLKYWIYVLFFAQWLDRTGKIGTIHPSIFSTLLFLSMYEDFIVLFLLIKVVICILSAGFVSRNRGPIPQQSHDIQIVTGFSRIVTPPHITLWNKRREWNLPMSSSVGRMVCLSLFQVSHPMLLLDSTISHPFYIAQSRCHL